MFKIKIGEKTFIVEVEELSHTTPKTDDSQANSLKLEEKIKPPIETKTIVNAESPDTNLIKAPIPGVVVSIDHKVGDIIRVGDILLILEAMKMRNEIYSPVNGSIKKINASQGQRVSSGTILMEISVE